MKNLNTKDNKGITLVSLIITIIILLILTTVITTTGLDTYKEAQVTKFVTQLKFMQEGVDNLIKEKTQEELLNLGTAITNVENSNAIRNAYVNQEITSNNTSEYRYFTKEQVAQMFETEDDAIEIMINFKTREIVAVKGIEYQGNTYYTQYKLPGGQTLINKSTETVRDLEFNTGITIDGLNATIFINNIKIANGTISYKEEGTNYWNTINNYTEANKEYKFAISKSGIYVIRLLDNASETTLEKQIEVQLANKPTEETDKTIITNSYNYGEESEKWAYSQNATDSTYYVWIPRFCYRTNETGNTEIKFVKKTSNIATDNTYIDGQQDGWITPTNFTQTDGTELTGVWINVNSANQAGINLIEILE